jgi:PST family polysaccharide transporter
MNDLKSRALRGGFAKLAAQAAIFVLRIGSVVVLARLLEPKDFGLVGMVTAVTGAFNLFKDAGLSVVTVQKADITDDQISTLFWINLLVGVILGLCCIALGPALVSFYREPRLFWVAAAMGLGFVLNSAGVQHAALLQRQMRFVALATVDIVSWVFSVAVGITLSVAGFGYWALVWMAVVLPTASTAGAWLVARWVPGRPRRRVGAGSMMRFGSTVTLNTLVVYVAYNADKLLVGRLWGAAALGIYGRAYQLINIPTDNLNSAVGGVAISALSRVQNVPALLKQYFLKSYLLVLSFTLPVTVASGLFAADIIGVVLGPKWEPAVPIFRLMAPTIFAFAIINPLGWLLFATGRVRRSLHMALVIAPAVILGYVSGLPFGAHGVAAGYSIAMALLTIPMTFWAIHGTVIRPRDLADTIGAPVLACAIATVVSVGASSALPASHAVTRLAVELGTLFGAYVLLLCFAGWHRTFYLGLLRDTVASLRKTPHPSTQVSRV